MTVITRPISDKIVLRLLVLSQLGFFPLNPLVFPDGTVSSSISYCACPHHTEELRGRQGNTEVFVRRIKSSLCNLQSGAKNLQDLEVTSQLLGERGSHTEPLGPRNVSV